MLLRLQLNTGAGTVLLLDSTDYCCYACSSWRWHRTAARQRTGWNMGTKPEGRLFL